MLATRAKYDNFSERCELSARILTDEGVGDTFRDMFGRSNVHATGLTKTISGKERL